MNLLHFNSRIYKITATVTTTKQIADKQKAHVIAIPYNNPYQISLSTKFTNYCIIIAAIIMAQ